MKIPAMFFTTIVCAGCVISPTAPEESPPPANQQEVLTQTMFDTLSSSIAWSRDELFLYTSGRSGLVQVERSTGSTWVIDPRATVYQDILLSGSGEYLYCLVRPEYALISTTYEPEFVIRYRLSTFAADTVASGQNMSFIPSPVSDEIACYYINGDSLVILDPSTGARRVFGSLTPRAYSPDGLDLLIGRYNETTPFSVLHRDSSVSQQEGARLSYPYFEQEIVWGIDGIKILYYEYPENGGVLYSVYDLSTGGMADLGSCSGWTLDFSADGRRIAYWKVNVTEWLDLFFFSVPSKEDVFLNITTLSPQSTESYTIEHSAHPSSVSTGCMAFSPTGTQVAFIYSGLLKTMTID